VTEKSFPGGWCPGVVTDSSPSPTTDIPELLTLLKYVNPSAT